MIIKNCENCDLEINVSRRTVKYCPECRIIKTKEIVKKYRDNNKEKISINYNEYRITHKEEIALRMKEYNKIYKKNHIEERKLYRKIKNQTDENYKIEQKLRSNLHSFLKSKKETRYSNLIGIILLEFKKWIEFNFIKNMNWENYGSLWHLDHVIPVSIFNLVEKEEQNFCFNWKNTRPLFAIKNVSRQYDYYDILMHELKINIYIKNNRLNYTNSKNIYYSVSNLPNHVRNNLMALVNL